MVTKRGSERSTASASNTSIASNTTGAPPPSPACCFIVSMTVRWTLYVTLSFESSVSRWEFSLRRPERRKPLRA